MNVKYSYVIFFLTFFLISYDFFFQRSFSICGKDNVCCRLPTTTTPKIFTTTAKVTTTTRKGLLNFISTILKPVPATPFVNQPQFEKCVSRKGKKIEKRILIDDYEDDDGISIGESSFAEFPWMIELLKKNRKTNSFEYKCGGVLSN